MEIFGVSNPTKKKVSLLIKTIEEELMAITIERMANIFLKTQGFLTKEDFNYLDNTDQKLVLLFPLPENV